MDDLETTGDIDITTGSEPALDDSSPPPLGDEASGVDSEPADEKAEEAKLELEGDKPAEEKPEEKPAEEPQKPKESAILRSIAKREKRLVEEKQTFRTERAQFEQQAAAVRQQLENAARQVEQERAFARQDPLAYLEQVHGLKTEDLARRILNGNKPSEEEYQRGVSKEIAELRAELRRRDEMLEQSRRQEMQRADERQIIAMAREEKAKFATLNRVYDNDMELLEECYRVAAVAKQRTGQVYTHSEILNFLEQREAKRYGRAGSDDQASSSSAQRSAGRTAPKANGSGNGPQGVKAEGTASPTLTNRAAAARATLPKDLIGLSPGEERELLIQIAEQASRQSA